MTLPYNSAKHLCRFGLLALSFSGVATAANFELSKFIEVGATTTDNFLLTDVDGIQENGLVFNIKPSVELKFTGNRFGLVALGEVEYIRFNDSDEEIVDPRLFTHIRGTLIDDLLFLDSTLELSNLSGDNSFPRPTDEGETAATSETRSYIERSFGRTADLYTGYTFSIFSDRTDRDSEVRKHTVDFSLGRNPSFGGIIWGLGGLYSRDESSTNEFENAYLYGKLGGAITQTLLAEFTYGVESRKLINAVNTDATEYDISPLWNAQLNWSPSELTTLTIGYGERFFGAGPNMQLDHRIRNSSISASYTRDITRQAATLSGIAILGDNTNPTIIDTDTVTVDDTNSLTPLDEPFVDNRFQLAYKLTGRRSDIIVDAIYSDRERLSGSDSIKSLLGRLVFDRKLSDFLRLRLQYDYQKSTPLNNIEENKFSIKFIYNFDGTDETTTQDSYGLE
ncbi:TIGR03016 family PEP-CTERM system-associated outer membrane protein [Granulosicoccus sp.]|nr:TIGR03016 family PEP-CTERM system-associated outer membrane protein [Granulosicoccus sp.]MDB4223197.1 TIGR03016 family PEP-CTERM system-associated outer membrane protein [Granulosicoccus sp.]